MTSTSSPISASYNSTTGVLTFTGTATIAAYEQALQSVTFNTTSSNTTSRSLTFTVTDTDSASGSGAASINIITAPVITPSGTTGTFTIQGSPVKIDSGDFGQLQ